MSSIDQRIVELQFDNRQFEQGVKTTLHTLDSLKKGLEFEDSAKSLRELGNTSNKFSMDNVVESLVVVSRKFSALEVIGITALRRLTDSAIDTGKKLLKSLSLDQVSSGWTKYEQKTASVQTILNATGKSIDEVNGYLDKLMWFSDETSYGFTDMTSALGQLTTAGGDINKLIPMIEGIANATAFAGKGTSEFSRAIYNLNQSYSSGALKYMDWKSLEQAGVVSKELKQTFIDTGIALGTLSKNGKTAKGQLVTIANFGETLKTNWATTEVMEKAFGAFAEMTEKAYEMVQSGKVDTASEAYAILAQQYDGVAIKAAKSAQEAKTFTEAITATKDAVSSGFMKSFDIIIGDYNEAKVLWTDVANALWDVFASGSEARNELLQSWKDLGGRDDLIAGLTNVFSSLYSIIKAVGSAMESIFPTPTAERLVEMTGKLKEFGDTLKQAFHYYEGIVYETEHETEVIKNPVEEFTRNLEKGMKGEDVKRLQEQLNEMGASLAVDGIFGPKTEKALKDFQSKSGSLVDGILNIGDFDFLDKLGLLKVTEEVVQSTKEITVFSSVLQRVRDIFRGLFALVKILFKPIEFGLKIVKNLISLLAPLGDALLTVGANIGNWLVEFEEWLSSSNLFARALNYLKEKFKPLGDTVKYAGEQLIEFFSTRLDFSKFTETFDRLKNDVLNSAMWKKASAFIGRTKNKLVSLFKSLRNSNVFKKASKYIPDFFSGAIKTLRTFIGNVPSYAIKIKDFFVDLYKSVIESDIAKKIMDKFKTFYNNLSTHIVDFYNRLKEHFPKIKDSFSEFFKTLQESETLDGYWNTIKDFFSNLISLPFDVLGIESGFNGIATSISNVWETIKGIASTIVETLMDLFGGSAEAETLDAVEENVEKYSGIAEKFKGGWDAVTSVLTPAMKWTGDFINKLGPGGLTAVAGFLVLGNSLIKTAGTVSKLFGSLTGLTGSFTKVIGSFGELGTSVTKVVDSFSGVVNDNGKTLSDGLKSLFEAFISTKQKDAKIDNVAKMVKQLAISIGVIVGAIIILGSMDPNVLKQGAIAIGGILASFVLFALLAKPIEKLGAGTALDSLGKSVRNIAIALLMMSGAVFLFGKMDWSTIGKGLLGIAGALLVLNIALRVIGKYGGDRGVAVKGLIGLGFSLLVLAGVIFVLSKMKWKTLGKGLIGLLSVILILRIILKTVGKFGGSNGVRVKGLLGVAFTILAFSMVIAIIGNMKWGTIGKGLIGALGIIMLFRIIIKAIGKFGGENGVKTSGLLGIAIAIAAMMGAIAILGTMPTETILKGLVGLIPIMIALAAVARAAGKLGSAKAGINSLMLFGSLILAVGAVVAAIYLLRDIDNSKILAFTLGLSALLLSVSAAAALSKVAGISGILSLVGLLLVLGAAIAGIVYACSKIAEDAKMVDFLNGGAEFLGKFFGTLSGAFKASEINAMNTGLKAISDININEDGLTRGITAATKIKEFSDKFGSIKISEAVANMLNGGSPFMVFCNGMSSFGEAVKKVNEGVSTLPVDIESKTETAISVADSIKALADSCGTVTIDEAIAKMFNGGSPFENFCKGMESFSKSIQNVDTNLSTISLGVIPKTYIAVAVAKSIKALADTCGTITIEASIAERIAGGSPFENFCKGMESFSKSIQNVDTNLSTISLGVIPKTYIAVAVAKSIKTLADTCGTITIEASIAEKIAGGSPFEKFCEGMESFGKSINTYNTNIADLNVSSILSKTPVAILAARQIGAFVEELSGMEIEQQAGSIAKWFVDDTKANTVIDSLIPLGESMKSFGESVKNISATSLQMDTTTTLDSLRSFATFLTELNSDQYNIQDAINDRQTGFKTVVIDNFVDAMSSVSEKLRSFQTDTADFDTERFSSITTSIKQIADSLTTLSTIDVSSIDTSAISGKMSEIGGAISQGIESANVDTSSIVNVVDDSISAINNKRSEFFSAGANVMLGLAAGIASSGVVAVAAAALVARLIVARVKSIFNEHSPSKVFEEIGMYADQGLANGFTDYSNVVTKASSSVANEAINIVRDSISNLNNIALDNIDADPVIRPVVDLSGVASGARAIGNMLGNTNYNIGSASMNLAASANASAVKNNQNGSGTTSTSYNNSTSNVLDFSGSTFAIRSEQDIHSLASELANLVQQQQRALGAT